MSRPLGNDLDVDVLYIRERLHIEVVERSDSQDHNQRGAAEDEKALAQREANDFPKHQ